MKTILQWLYGIFFFFALTGVAFAPVGDPGMYPAPNPRYNLNLTQPQILTEEALFQYAIQINFFDPHLLVAIAKVESDLQPRVKSIHKGVTYYGLMQMCFATAKMLGYEGRPADLMNWKTNARLAAKYLDALHTEHGTKKKAVAAYNAGTVIPCKKCTNKSEVVNQKYVDKVMLAYAEVKGFEQRN